MSKERLDFLLKAPMSYLMSSAVTYAEFNEILDYCEKENNKTNICKK